MTETINKALITVTFYFGDGSNPLFRLSKKYIVQRWDTETALRNWLDEIATELNHLSGYGIFSIKVEADELKFSIDYRNKLTPYREESEIRAPSYWFTETLRFQVGYLYGVGKLWLEIPRILWAVEQKNPVPMYEPGDSLFKIRTVAFHNKKEKKRKGTKYLLSYDYENSFLLSFVRKIVTGIVVPNTRTPYFKQVPNISVEAYIKQPISWWHLPQSQTTLYQLKKNREREEKRQKAAERQKRQMEKAGVVYKDEKRKSKAKQVYIIQMAGDRLGDHLYKIGISHTPGKRLQSLKTSSPFELQLVHKFVAMPAEEAEAKLHEKYQTYRMSGEWFQLPAEKVAELKQILEYCNGEFVVK